MSWKTTTIGSVCDVIAGQSPESSFYNKDGNGLPFYQGKKDFGEKYINEPTVWTTQITKEAEQGDILMSVRAPVGPINLATRKICIGRGLAAIRAKNEINKNYLFYFLRKIESELVGSSGAVFNSINKSQIASIKIPLPSLATQQKIVKKLDAIFAEIDRATAATEANVKNAEALWQALIDKVITDFNLFKNPTSFSEVVYIKSKLVDPKEDKFQKLLHIGAGNIISNTGEICDLKTAKEENLISGKFLFDEETILYSKIRPYLKKVTKARFLGLCSADVYPLKCHDGKLTKDFLFYILLSTDFTRYAISGSERAGMPKVNREHLFAYEFNLPTISQQESLTGKINSAYEVISVTRNNLARKVEELISLKQSILEKAFSGDLVKE